MIDWKIDPLVGVGPIKFGMTRQEVFSILGSPEFMDSKKIPLEGKIPNGVVVTEFRIFEGGTEQHQPSVTYNGDHVESIDIFEHHQTLRLGDIYIFKNTPIVTAGLLSEVSKHYANHNTSYIFLDLGISMGGTSWEASETVNVFERGNFDDHVEEWSQKGQYKIVRK